MELTSRAGIVSGLQGKSKELRRPFESGGGSLNLPLGKQAPGLIELFLVQAVLDGLSE